VGPSLVVPVEPFLSEIPEFGQRLEQIGAENLFTVGPIEALVIGILIRLAGLDVAGFDALLFAPVREHLTRQLRAGRSWRRRSVVIIPRPAAAAILIRCRSCCGFIGVQLFYNLSDPAMEDVLYEIDSVRRVVG